MHESEATVCISDIFKKVTTCSLIVNLSLDTDERSTGLTFDVLMQEMTTDTGSYCPTEETGTNAEDGDYFDFRILVLITGWLGLLSNGFTVAVFLANKHLRSSQKHILVINQSLIDFFTALVLIVSFSQQIFGENLQKLYYHGLAGELRCRWVDFGATFD